MNTPRILLILSTFTLTLTACEEADPEPVVASYSLAVEKALDNIEFSRAPGYPLDVLQERVNVAVDAMYDVANHAETWEDAHALAQQHIRDADPGVMRATVEQSMAKLLLVGYLAPNHEDPEAAELALQYTRTLVQHGSPEAEAVLETATAFRSEWKPADLRAVAIGAADAVEAHVEGGTPCRDCELPTEARRVLVETGKTDDVISLRRLAAARELRALAG